MAKLELEPRRLAPDAKSLTTAKKLPQEGFNGLTSMLITLPRGYEKCPFGSLFSFIRIMFFHFHGIRSRVEQGAP